jgi:hypothetical protein
MVEILWWLFLLHLVNWAGSHYKCMDYNPDLITGYNPINLFIYLLFKSHAVHQMAITGPQKPAVQGSPST